MILSDMATAIKNMKNGSCIFLENDKNHSVVIQRTTLFGQTEFIVAKCGAMNEIYEYDLDDDESLNRLSYAIENAFCLDIYGYTVF